MSSRRFLPNDFLVMKLSLPATRSVRLFGIAVLLFVAVAGQAGPAARQWPPAAYRGITVGKSKLVNMLLSLGQPESSRHSKRDEDARQETRTNYEKVSQLAST